MSSNEPDITEKADDAAKDFYFFSRNEPKQKPDQHVEQILSLNKREGINLAVRARWVALAITSLLLVMTNQSWSVLYYHAILIGLAFIGWLQLKAGKVERSRWELTLLFCDIVLMTVGMLLPNPFLEVDWPTATQYKLENFKYFYIFLAVLTLGYSWRTVFSYGTWVAGLWLFGMLMVLIFGVGDPEMSRKLLAGVSGDARLLSLIDPSDIRVFSRIEEAVLFLIVATILAINSFRMHRLLLRQAATTRERTNLSRHFSPNMVEQLADQDDPFGEVRAQDVAVMFVDVVGFTHIAETKSPQEVVSLLRDLHRLLEETVFDHHGTLEKYLGDGAMISFGTPVQSEHDARNAIRCAQSLVQRTKIWNTQRAENNQEAVNVSIGVHYGSVILGDIGTSRRLEFATLGDTVNVASRLEEMTRSMNCQCIISDQLVSAFENDRDNSVEDLSGFKKIKAVQPLRGRDQGIKIWAR